MTATPPDPETAVPARRAPTILAVAASLLVGGAVGAFGVGPALGPQAAAESTEATAAGEGEHGAAAPAALMFTLDGVIVNPAGSRGQHHLITTVAFKLTAAADEARLRGAEVALRDEVGGLLEQKSLDELTAPGARDRLRDELKRLVQSYVTVGTVTVYLPQYIVQ